MLLAFSNISRQMQLENFQVETSYQNIEIEMVFHSNKNQAHNIQQIKVNYTHQAIKYNLIQYSNKGVIRNLTFQECAMPTARTI